MSSTYVPSIASSGVRVPYDGEEARALLQHRLSFFAKVLFLLSFGFYVFVNLVEQLRPGVRWDRWLTGTENVLHLGATAGALVIWLLTRRGAIRGQVLAWIDASFVSLLVLTYGMTGILLEPSSGVRFEHVLILIAMTLQMLRAVVIPSRARQTAIVGALVSAIVIAQTYFIAGFGPHPPGVPLQLIRVLYIAIWCMAALIVATLASRVIYGLRAQVRQARRIGQYTLEEEVGAGGMGVVYRARHAMLRRPTAIKLLPADRSAGPAVARFEREVVRCSALTSSDAFRIFSRGDRDDSRCNPRFRGPTPWCAGCVVVCRAQFPRARAL
jgi:serine/threonine-protein kinase